MTLTSHAGTEPTASRDNEPPSGLMLLPPPTRYSRRLPRYSAGLDASSCEHHSSSSRSLTIRSPSPPSLSLGLVYEHHDFTAESKRSSPPPSPRDQDSNGLSAPSSGYSSLISSPHSPGYLKDQHLSINNEPMTTDWWSQGLGPPGAHSMTPTLIMNINPQNPNDDGIGDEH